MTQKTPSRTRRILGATATLLGTAAAIGAAGTLVWLGTNQIAARADKLDASVEIAPIPVLSAPLVESGSYTVRTAFSGRVEARRALGLGFEQGGTVAFLTVEEGERVKAGETIARLDTRTLAAERAAQAAGRDALRAQAELAELTTNRQRELLAAKHISEARYDDARLTLARIEAEIRSVDAAIQAIDVLLDKAVLRAPFDAVIGTRFVDDGTRVAGGQPIVQLFEDTADQFRVGLPRSIAARLVPGEMAVVEIDGERFDARVVFIRDDIDPATRTQSVILGLPDNANLPDGSLGTLSLSREVTAGGAWVPSTALVEGVRGLWTLYLIEDGADGPVARREAVELIHSDGDRAYVRGAFGAAARIVSNGPHRVSDGQPVALGEGS